jgi:nicotinamide-nucleotide amidase
MPEPLVLEDLAVSVIERMTARGLRLATAESTVGGLIGYALTAVPGASKVFAGGITAYANAPKRELLKVSEETLAEYGSISAAAVEGMANGAIEAFDVDVAVAESGIASPTANRPDPGGLYYIGVVAKDHQRVERYEFEGDRTDTMREAATVAVWLISDYLDTLDKADAPEPEAEIGCP